MLQGFDEEQFVARLHYYRSVGASLALFKAAAESNIELLTLVFPEDWAWSGHHEEFGAFSLEDWLHRAASHAYEHAEQLRNQS